MISWLLALLASSQVPYELLALVSLYLNHNQTSDNYLEHNTSFVISVCFKVLLLGVLRN